MIRTVVSGVRKCGLRKEGGVYLVGGEGAPGGILDRFTLINPPVPYQTKLHRGPRIVDGNAILERKDIKDWWAEGSKETEEKKAGNEWALDVFGMTVHQRLQIGECKGAKDSDDALSILVSKATLDPDDKRLVALFSELINGKIQEETRAVLPYSQFHENLVAYRKMPNVAALIKMQATTWLMAYGIPPNKLPVFIPTLMRILALLGLPKYALELNKTFLQGDSRA